MSRESEYDRLIGVSHGPRTNRRRGETAILWWELVREIILGRSESI